MQVVQTPGPPPNQGRIYLAMRGWTWNTRKAPRKMVSAKIGTRRMLSSDTLVLQTKASTESVMRGYVEDQPQRARRPRRTESCGVLRLVEDDTAALRILKPLLKVFQSI